MLQSMTGFGDARLEDDERSYLLEVRSVNNRYLKSSIYLPDDFAFCEPEVEKVLRTRLIRGSVILRLHVRAKDPEAALDIDHRVLQAYLKQLRAVAGDDPRTTINLATLVSLPGVTQPQDLSDEERAARWKVLERLVNEALDRLVQMRRTEGSALAADLLGHCSAIEQSLERVQSCAPDVVKEYRDRLQARVSDLIAGSGIELAEDDLLKEVSVYAERSDISEELNRLAGHLEQFRQVMQQGDAAGRKLEFISQEMLREANTIGSKAGSAVIAREIIEVKSAIDRIKEQVQNAE